MAYGEDSHRGPATDQQRWEVADGARKAQRQGRHGLAEFALNEGLPLGTVRRWARVARAFPPPERRTTGLTFSHLEAVATHPERKRLLELAVRERWSAGRLRAEAASSQTASSASNGHRSFGPATLDEASRYLSWLAQDRDRGRVPDASVRTRIDRLARVSGDLSGSWDDAA